MFLFIRKSIKLKFIILYSFIFSALLFALYIFIFPPTLERAYKKIISDLFSTRSLFAELNYINIELLFSEARLLSSSPRIKEYKSLNIDNFNELFENYKDALTADIIIIVDEFGVCVFDSTDSKAAGKNMLENDLVKKILEQGNAKFASNKIINGKIYQTAGMPIIVDNDITGMIIIGKSITNEQLNKMKQISKCDIAFISKNNYLISTFDNDTAYLKIDLKYLDLLQIKSPDIYEFDEKIVMILKSLFYDADEKPLGYYTLIKSLDEEHKILKNLLHISLALAIVFLTAAFILIFWSTGKLLKPIMSVIYGTKQIIAGNYQYNITVKAEDETKLLAEAFNDMTKNLRIKEEMKYFLSSSVLEFVNKSEAGITQDSASEQYVTILFTDICGFTPLSEKLPPKEITDILNGFYDAMTTAIESHNGVVDKFIGDAIMAIFFDEKNNNIPSSLNAVNAGKSMLTALEKFNESIENKIAIRIGINTGKVILGPLGSKKRRDFTVIGDAVNLAQRLEANAEKNSILISEYSLFPIVDIIKVKCLPPISVKGKKELIAVYSIILT